MFGDCRNKRKPKIIAPEKVDKVLELDEKQEYKIVCPKNFDEKNFKVIMMIFDELDFIGNLVVTKQDLEYNNEQFTFEFIKLKYQKLLEEIEKNKINIKQQNSRNFINKLDEIEQLKCDYLMKYKMITEKYNQDIEQINDDFNLKIDKLQSELFVNPNIELNSGLINECKKYHLMLENNDYGQIRSEFFNLCIVNDDCLYFKDIFELLKDFSIKDNLTMLKSLNQNKFNYMLKQLKN
jgi:hypothetical protein